MKILCFIVITAVMVTCLILVCRLAARAEAKDWNGGYCPICGKELRHFDDDSQGGHGWCCDDCHYYTWVSYHKWVYKTKRKELYKEMQTKKGDELS